MTNNVNLGDRATDTTPFSEKRGGAQTVGNHARVTNSFLEQLKVLEEERKKILFETSDQERRIVEQDRQISEQEQQLQALAEDRVSIREELSQVRKDTECFINQLGANKKASQMNSAWGNRQFAVAIGIIATMSITAVVIVVVNKFFK